VRIRESPPVGAGGDFDSPAPAGGSPPGPRPPLGWRGALLFASGDFACNLYWQSVALYLLFYYTDVVRLAPEAAGLVYLAGSIWDGLAGLVVGLVADRRGRRGLAAYLLFGALPLALSFLLLYWAPPLAGTPLLWVVLASHLLFRSLYALVNIPYAALSAQVAPTSAGRARIAGLRMIFGAAAAALVATGTQAIGRAVSGRPDGAIGFLAAAGLFSAIATAMLLLVGRWFGRDAPGAGLPDPPPFRATLRSIGRNRAFLILNLAMFAAVVAITMVTKGTLYYFKYRIGDEGAAGGALALMGIAGVLFVPPWMAVTARWGGKVQWLASIAAGSAMLAAFGATEPTTASGMTLILIGFQASITGISFGFWAMLPDTVDYGEEASGVRVQVLLFGLAALVQKIAFGLAAALVGLLLQLSGYVANVRQAAETLTSLGRAMTLVPLLALAFSALAMTFNPLRPIGDRADKDQGP
jgi:Na+/melibiose symporter-like transporter